MASDDTDEVLRKGTLTLAACFVGLLAFIWVGIYGYLGIWLSALIPLTYQVAVVISLVLFVRTKQFRAFRTTQLVLMLILPFLLQGSLGGFASGSAVSLWALVAPIGALMFVGLRQARPWFYGFVALIIASAVLEFTHFLPQPDIPAEVRLVFFLMNLIGVALTVFVLLVYFVGEREKMKTALEAEHLRSETLLLNVLPAPVADRLKMSSDLIADGYEGVTVLFADIVGFTPLSARLTPGEVVTLLNHVFTSFDQLVEAHRVEKIKTIGDAYMVAAGVPIRRDDHAAAIADLALQMKAEVAKVRETTNMPLDIRIGVDSGPVVAGVIGRRKFIYDLWGDTVNTASRMESHGTAGEIQVTERTWCLLRASYRFRDRGMIEVKGKGLMHTYFLEQRL
ncbi:MAG: adenylate/guanylate cyclase domain-containing protein [Candidatus Dormiibacterota bacterium]